MKVFLAAYLASLLATPALATKSFRGGKEVVDFAAMVESSCAGASVDLRIVSAGYLIGNTAEFYLNGAKLTDAKSMRGMNVVYLNADDDAMEGSEKFDTYLHHDEDDKMLAYLQNIPAGRIVMISAKDEAAKKCDDECETGLKLIGATIFPTIFRGSYIVAGRKDGAVIVNKQDGSKKIEWSGSTCAATPESHVKINYYSAELTGTTMVDTTAELETTVSGSTSTTADSGAYCTKDLTTMHRHANKNICSGGSNRNVMQRFTIKFYEPSTSGSDWQFRFNLDSTHGTVASIDGENVVTKSGDVWLGANKDMETPSKSLAKGAHEFLVVGAENCCDGEAADWEFKRGADHDWERITTESLVKIANTPDLNLGTLTSSGAHNVATYQKITAAEGAMSLKGAGWCSAGSNQEWKGRRFTGNPAACKAKCESEATCIGYWQYVHPSPSAGTCTMFATSGYLSGTGFSTKYDRNGRGNAASAADFILAHTSRTNLECWTKTQ